MNIKNCTLSLSICMMAILMSSCTKMFPNDDLDHMWRLDTVTFLDGYDFNGNKCSTEDKTDAWFCFARDLVEVRDGDIHGPIGVVTDYGDSLRFDFTLFEEGNPGTAMKTLKSCGINSIVTTFNIEKLTRIKMIIRSDKTRLSFTRW